MRLRARLEAHFHLLQESTVEISKVTLDRVIVAVDSSQYALSEAKCNSGACKSWKPKEGGYYPATIVDKPAYVPTCLKVGTQWEENRMHAALTASRALCVGFGKIFDQRIPALWRDSHF